MKGGWTSRIGSSIDAAPASAALAWVAQLVEQRIENPRVGGSNPPPGTIPSSPLRPPVLARRKRTVSGAVRAFAAKDARSTKVSALSKTALGSPVVKSRFRRIMLHCSVKNFAEGQIA